MDNLNAGSSYALEISEDLLRWAKAMFGGRLAALSAMQKAGSVVCHMLHTYRLDVPVLFVDTRDACHDVLRGRGKIVKA